MDPETPPQSPPPGMNPNFENPPNGNLQAHFGIAICLALVFVGVSLRIYSRVFCIKDVKLEDYVALAALGPYVAFIYGLYRLLSIVGFYVHGWNVPPAEVPSVLYIVYLNTSFFQATIGLVKVAILIEWSRLFVPRGTKNGFYWTCQGIMWVNITYYTAGIIISGLSCMPHEKIWNSSLPGRCFNTKAFFVSNASLNLASDIIILALPQKIIWNLHLSKKKKIGVSLVFAVGIIASLVGAVRLSKAVLYYAGDDNIYNISAVLLWCTAELSIAFLVFCLPAIPPIFSGTNKLRLDLSKLRLWPWSSSNRSRDVNRSGKFMDDLTCNSSAFIRTASIEAWEGRINDEVIKQPYPPPVYRPMNSRQEFDISAGIRPTTLQRQPSIRSDNGDYDLEHKRHFIQDTRRHPNTSWYDET
ncbi:hypothetical protein GGS20DRAFT_582759 [Poronia punctata]|nr:hypothetical protein GGS20DRAFT_582759 [Poronia punctata]